jgi:SAM-dependent methyltransferase
LDAERWRWDETLFAGSAPYYALGRLPYPETLADAFRDELALDGTGRLIDVGCGTGQIALLLAPLLAEVIGLDADAEMIAEAKRQAARRGCRNIEWIHARAEHLPLNLGRFSVATFAQSFHWMDRERVASTVFGMLEPGGTWVHVDGTTHRGVEGVAKLPFPSPPREEIAKLLRRFLGPLRRAGSAALPHGTPAGEEGVMRNAGFSGPRSRLTPGGRIVNRSEDEIVASIFSTSSSAPHLFGEHRQEFEAELPRILRTVSPQATFSEQTHDVELLFWDRPKP